MMNKLKILANILIDYSINVKENEKVLISVDNGVDKNLIRYIMKNIIDKGGYPYLKINDEEINNLIYENLSDLMIDSIVKRKKFEVEGRVIIVPDEEQIEEDLFDDIIVGNENHVDRYQDFSDKYHLGYKFSENDSYIAPLTMASIGHFCYNTAESISNILMYIPEVVTKRQYDYFVNNKEMILKYVGRKATAVKKRDGNLIIEALDDFDLIEKEVNKRYEEYKKKGEEKGHVR